MHRGDFTSIAEAIEKVQPGTRILVRKGFYKEGLLIDKPLEIIGDGETKDVVIQAIGAHVIRFQANMGRVANLTLQQMGGTGEWYCVDIAQGRLELEDCDIKSESLACVGIHGGADPRLRRNRIHDSKTGSGVYVYENAQGTLEDNDIFNNALSGVQIHTLTNPTLRRNRIHDGKRGGVFINEGGQGLLEDNEIFGHLHSGVQIATGANPTLRRNRIRDNEQCGVYVYDSGQGIIEYNYILGNSLSGIYSSGRGNPVVKNNQINKNLRFAIEIFENGGGTFENNDLTENTKGAWHITTDSEANVRRVNNKE
jgi:F-box protein 11